MGNDVLAVQFGWTALMFAASKGHASVVEMLLQHDAQINLTDDEVNTAN